MSKYSIKLRDLTLLITKPEIVLWFSSYNLADYLTAEEIAVISARGTWSKERLANKIYRKYQMREIGFEAPGLFKENALGLMDSLMEEYAPLIYSAAIKYDPLVNVDFTETYHHDDVFKGSNEGESRSTSENTGLNIHSDTPQGQITKAKILDGSYATDTNGTENNIADQTNSEVNINNTDTRDYTKTIKGNSGVSATAQKMIEQYRQNIIAIDREIVEKCAVLFMGVL